MRKWKLFRKKLLRDYFYGDLPSDLQIKFLEQFEISRDELIQRVYKEPLPNEFIASFLPFSENIEHTYCDNTISLGLKNFCASILNGLRSIQNCLFILLGLQHIILIINFMKCVQNIICVSGRY